MINVTPSEQGEGVYAVSSFRRLLFFTNQSNMKCYMSILYTLAGKNHFIFSCYCCWPKNIKQSHLHQQTKHLIKHPELVQHVSQLLNGLAQLIWNSGQFLWTSGSGQTIPDLEILTSVYRKSHEMFMYWCWRHIRC